MASITIITVCRNAEHLIAKTIASVSAQTYTPHEYVVIDGASTDSTLKYFKNFLASPLKIISEKDSSIYDAMNKAVRMATGDYVYFLNAGDVFTDANVIADISAFADKHSNPSLLFGNVIYVWENISGRRRFAHINSFTLPVSDLCHQAVFAKRSLFSDVGIFDLSYKLAADFDWFLRIFRQKYKGVYFDRDIAFYDGHGVSATKADEVEHEKFKILRLHYSSHYLYFWKFVYRLARKLFGIGQLERL
ncbi:MAG: glycosyltransferase [Cytophaga sp.]|nr:glycosyltransferase [Undibacterium sp.]